MKKGNLPSQKIRQKTCRPGYYKLNCNFPKVKKISGQERKKVKQIKKRQTKRKELPTFLQLFE